MRTVAVVRDALCQMKGLRPGVTAPRPVSNCISDDYFIAQRMFVSMEGSQLAASNSVGEWEARTLGCVNEHDRFLRGTVFLVVMY